MPCDSCTHLCHQGRNCPNEQAADIPPWIVAVTLVAALVCWSGWVIAIFMLWQQMRGGV